MKTHIHLRENFIPENLVEHYLTLAETAKWARVDNEIWDNRSCNLIRYDYEISSILMEKVQEELRNTTGRELYADTFNLVRWRVGDRQEPHADAENPDGTPHPYPWREYACMLYLNSNFEGGEIYFPDYDIEIKPRPGLLVFFPGTLEYLHGVREITEGVRYTVGCFWTTDYTKRMRRFYDWRFR
jgi:hypothetical protein